MTQADLDRIRRIALDNIDKHRKRAKAWLTGAGLFEAVMFVAVIWVADFGNPTHLMLFLCTCLIYGPLALGLFALRAHIDTTEQRILKAVHLAGHEAPEEIHPAEA